MKNFVLKSMLAGFFLTPMFFACGKKGSNESSAPIVGKTEEGVDSRLFGEWDLSAADTERYMTGDVAFNKVKLTVAVGKGIFVVAGRCEELGSNIFVRVEAVANIGKEQIETLEDKSAEKVLNDRKCTVHVGKAVIKYKVLSDEQLEIKSKKEEASIILQKKK